MCLVKELPECCIIISATIEEFIVSILTVTAIDTFKKTLERKYRVTFLDTPTTFLGWTIQMAELGPINLSQLVLITEPLVRASLNNGNTRWTTLPKNTDFDEPAGYPSLSALESLLFQSLLGDVINLTDSTLSEITFEFTRLTTFLMKRTTQNMELLEHTVRYVKGTSTHGSIYQQSHYDWIYSFADADYTSAHDRRAKTRHLNIPFNAPVAWTSKNQAMFALSTWEADYLAVR